MPRHILVVDRLSDWRWSKEGLNIVSVNSYLTAQADDDKKGFSPYVINLCRRYEYLSGGYYCSLLAEARGQLPMPTVPDVMCLARKKLYSFALPRMESLLRKAVKKHQAEETEPFHLTFMFGHADDKRFKRLGEELFDVFRYPILDVRVVPSKPWRISEIKPLGLHQVPERLDHLFIEAVRSYTRARRHAVEDRQPALYNMAILYDPQEALPPSNIAALNKFIQIGQTLRIDIELITKKDYSRLPEFDALFIRTNTSIDHYTYQFARKAEQEGLVVIDDPASILRCTNKVYLQELLARHHVKTPGSVIINRQNFTDETFKRIENELGYPVILKIPDGSFSRGMHKAKNREELVSGGNALLEHSRLILAQEYLYTPYDWRVGILNGAPLFVCQYMMSGKHWQIVNHKKDGSFQQGGFKTFAVEDAPQDVVETARRAASLVGNGLYGVDMKQTEKGLFVIEINDNPNIDVGVEDKVMKDGLYVVILKDFIRRIINRV